MFSIISNYKYVSCLSAILLACALESTANALPSVNKAVEGDIELWVDKGTGYVYLAFTGYSTNPSMEFGAFQIVSPTNAISSKANYLVDGGSNWYPAAKDPNISFNEVFQWHCCCVNNGYGMQLSNPYSGINLTMMDGVLVYNLGQIYDINSGAEDLIFAYSNYATMDSLMINDAANHSVLVKDAVTNMNLNDPSLGLAYDAGSGHVAVEAGVVKYFDSIAVPEPATIGMMVLTTAGLLIKRRGKI